MNNNGKQTVLIVDDQESIRLALSRLLSQEGYDVLLAEDGESALGLLREKKVNVILSDMKMHKMDGLRLLKTSKVNQARSRSNINNGTRNNRESCRGYEGWCIRLYYKTIQKSGNRQYDQESYGEAGACCRE